MAITRPVYEILNEGANALDTLAHRLAAGPDPSAAMPGTEQEGDGGGDGGAAAAAPVAAAAAAAGGRGAGKGEEKAVGPETPWVRELFEAFMRVGVLVVDFENRIRPRPRPTYPMSQNYNPFPDHTHGQATFRLGLKVHLRKLAHSPALEAYLQATGMYHTDADSLE